MYRVQIKLAVVPVDLEDWPCLSDDRSFRLRRINLKTEC